MKQLKRMEIVWRDTSSRKGWADDQDVEEKINEADYVMTLGYLIKKTKHKIILTTGHSCWGTYMDIVAIPKCSIIAMSELVIEEKEK